MRTEWVCDLSQYAQQNGQVISVGGYNKNFVDPYQCVQ